MHKCIALLGLLTVAGCYAGRGESAGRDVPPVEASYVANWEDVRDVIWLEWGGASWRDIAYAEKLQEEEKLSDEDLFVLLFIARNMGHPLSVVVDIYKEKSKDLNQVVLAMGVPRDTFFLEIPKGLPAPGVFTHPYKLFRSRSPGGMENKEYTALVVMRIGVDYFGYKERKFFDEYQRTRGFRPLFTIQFHRAGWGGRDAAQKTAPILPRPWVRANSDLFYRNREEATGAR